MNVIWCRDAFDFQQNEAIFRTSDQKISSFLDKNVNIIFYSHSTLSFQLFLGSVLYE